MLTYKIFLASSNELAADRIAVGDMLQQYNDRLVTQQKQVHFTLYKWEGDTISFADRRKQCVYNDNIETCHIFILLYETKVGMYTEEEYDFAYNRFKQTGFPQVIVFKKTTTKPVEDTVPLFEAKIGRGGDEQFRSSYTDATSLKVQFFDELQKLFAKGILKYGATDIYNDGQSVPTNFIGRDEELKAIKQKLEKSGKLMLINAEGGIGKTTLAAKYWQESQADYDHRAWLFCENGIISGLKKLAPPLNIDLSNMTEEEQLVNLKAGLQHVSHRFLLVLDNANTPEDIEAFKQNFRGFQWHVLITSRCKGVAEHSTEYEEYAVTTLPPQQAKELFISNYKEDTAGFDALLDRLLIAINYHTLLVEIFSKHLLIASELDENLKTLLDKLETDGLYLKEDSHKISSFWTEHNKHLRRATTDVILDLLYDFTQLSANEAERYALVNIALLPAVPYTLLFLADVFNIADKNVFLETLKDLTRKGWLSFDKKEYRINPVVQQLTLEKNKDSLQVDSENLITSLNDKMENDGTYLKHFNKAAPFVALSGTIVKHLIKDPFYGLGQLSFNTATYFLSSGNLIEALAAIENYKKISELIGDKNGLALSFSKLGDVHNTIGQLDKALEYYQERNRIGKELCQENSADAYFKNGLAISFSKLGSVHETMGQLEKALEYYGERNRIGEELHRDYPSDVSFKDGLAISYERLGGVHEILGQLDKALEYYGDAAKLFEEMYRDYPSDVSFKNGLAISFEKLGGLYETMGQLDKALEYYGKDVKLSEELHRDYPSDVSFKNGLAVSFQRLGIIYKKNKEFTFSLDNLKQSIQLCEKLHNDYPIDVSFKRNLALSYQWLGLLYEEMTTPALALEMYYKSKFILQALATSFPSYVDFNTNLKWVENRLKKLGDG